VAVHGNDYLDGEGGADTLIGGGRDDVVFGGEGDETLLGNRVFGVLDEVGWFTSERVESYMKFIAKKVHPTLGKGGFLHESGRRTPWRIRDRVGVRLRTSQARCDGAGQSRGRAAT
jgi:Ca2+-binding RTX toxin-like protein